jgi:hypothetical protein
MPTTRSALAGLTRETTVAELLEVSGSGWLELTLAVDEITPAVEGIPTTVTIAPEPGVKVPKLPLTTPPD